MIINSKKILLPFKLFPWQEDIIRGIFQYPHDIHIAKSQRQVGKSITVEVLLLYYSINKCNNVNICISPTLNQSRKIYKELVKGLINTPLYQSANATTLEINLTNGSSILLKSSEQSEGLRGFTVSGILIFDEAVFCKDSVIYECLPFVNANRCPILMTSTPKLKSGCFYEFYNNGLNGVDGFHSYDICDYDTSILLPKDKLEMYRKSVAPQIFRCEFLGQFIEGVSELFGNVEKLVGTTISPSNNVVMGVDWGSGNGGDDTAITIMNEHKEVIKIFYFNDKDVLQTIDFIIDKIKTYNVKKCVCESNSLGSTYLNLLKGKISQNNIRCQIIDFVTTNESKRQIIESLQVECLNGTIQLIKDNKYLLEFVSYQMEKTPSNKITYNAIEGQHDDLIISTALALYALRVGQYKYR